MPLVERLQGQGGVTGVTPIASQAPVQLGKALDLIKTILAPGADGTPPPLGQVNGALGQTIGNLLNGKKTAIGLLGAVITPMLTQASATTALAPILAMLTPAAGLAPLHPADLPRADRLGRARQDGEMVPRHRAETDPKRQLDASSAGHSFAGAPRRREPGIHIHRRWLLDSGLRSLRGVPE